VYNSQKVMVGEISVTKANYLAIQGKAKWIGPRDIMLRPHAVLPREWKELNWQLKRT